MFGLILRPNDRICIGSNAIFLFKYKAKEDQMASIIDPEDDPISFDFANEEILEFAEETSRIEKEIIEEQNRKHMDDLKARLEEE